MSCPSLRSVNVSSYSALDLLKLCLLLYLLASKSGGKVLRQWASVFPRWYKRFIKLIPAMLCKLYQVAFILNKEINRSNMLQGFMLYAWTISYFYIWAFFFFYTVHCNVGQKQTLCKAIHSCSTCWFPSCENELGKPHVKMIRPQTIV